MIRTSPSTLNELSFVWPIFTFTRQRFCDRANTWCKITDWERRHDGNFEHNNSIKCLPWNKDLKIMILTQLLRITAYLRPTERWYCLCSKHESLQSRACRGVHKWTNVTLKTVSKQKTSYTKTDNDGSPLLKKTHYHYTISPNMCWQSV